MPNDVNPVIERVSSVRLTQDNATVLNTLGLLADLAGTWEGEGFNLIARPDFEGNANLYLQLNRTHENLKIDPIGSPIPNRGFGQKDITLFGLTYLQKISDASNKGALHIEPGLWVTQPSTAYPPEEPPPTGQIVARMGSIPHGNALLAQGSAVPFKGVPVLKSPTAEYAFSQFPSFNSTPFPIPPSPAQPVINAAGSSEALTAAAAGVPPFNEYDLGHPANAGNPRTPFATVQPDPLIANGDPINGVPLQDAINDPIKILQATVEQQVHDGYAFEGTVLNIATQRTVAFFDKANSKPGDPQTVVTVADGAGGIENILFLEGGEPAGPKGPNADTALVYATFWIEKLTHESHPPFVQLQYAQMVVLNFDILLAPNPVLLGWPHVSVATLRKPFN